ncbi:hypothetical protein [Actinoplanes sp. G11-F43]|uniref:hypothetical protein n=1 Tax=Actinoplanes sp. G11-F43 TaxID=3424130 RepID=UPI003D342FDE
MITGPMGLTTEALGTIPAIDPARLDEVLAADAFGKFAVLSGAPDDYLQAGNVWTPDATGDPWVLEYREDGHHHRADGVLTLERVREAFRSYLTGGSEWRTGFTWS